MNVCKHTMSRVVHLKNDLVLCTLFITYTEYIAIQVAKSKVVKNGIMMKFQIYSDITLYSLTLS